MSAASSSSRVFTQVSNWKVFSGNVTKFTHLSAVTNSKMTLSVFLPSKAAQEKVPVVYWLSGLTCTDDNFVQKAAAFETAQRLGLALVAPDTSPRVDLPGDKDAYDFGQGAGFYVNATLQPWAQHYQMFDYVNQELPLLVNQEFPVLPDKQSIMGHSMGGHGALVSALRQGSRSWKSVSAFAPICNPINCAWGQKAFKGYLGEDLSAWKQFDAVELLKSRVSLEDLPEILIDVGTADKFYQEKQLLPEAFEEVAREKQAKLQLRFQEGYDHSYFFISSFIRDHLEFHSKFLQ